MAAHAGSHPNSDQIHRLRVHPFPLVGRTAFRRHNRPGSRSGANQQQLDVSKNRIICMDLRAAEGAPAHSVRRLPCYGT